MALEGASSSLSSASTSSRHRWTHDVFLSFRGKDVRQKFISHLYDALEKKGINTYIDDELKRGEEISQALFQAIKGSMISIIVFSKNYAESRWCLNELLKIRECMRTTKQIVLPVFYEVDPSDVRNQKESFGEAFAKLKDRYEGKVEVQKWEEALKELANIAGLELKNYRKESEFIQEIIQWVDLRIINQTPLSIAKYPIGIESRMRQIYEHLSIGKNDIIRIVGIFGTGGIGKTTISKYIYNQISSQFEGSCFLKDVRETSKSAGGLIKLQNTLLNDILGTRLDVHDVDKGINVIRHRLFSKRILLILDDVDELGQIEKLAGDRDWFGSGSRILITTRDQCLLDNSKVDSRHEVMILDHEEALQLFSLHAFEEKEPPEDYKELSEQVTKYAQGLPLALKVLGSDLKGQSIHHWKSAMDKYREIPNGDIQKVLLVSYEDLDDKEKEMFLDIAFFFKREPLAKVMRIFDSCRFFPVPGIKRLIDKCLISTIERYYEGHNESCVWMHDLIQDMGREIVRLESPKEPSKRSRLWFHKDIREVLEESTGPNKIEGMLVDLPEGEGDEEISLHPEAFGHMERLRIFINRNARFSCAPNCLSHKVRVLDWPHPAESLPLNFKGENLIVFNMRHSLVKELGDGFKPKNLTTMTFRNCNFLEKIPDLSSTRNLKELIAIYCTRLVEVHDSVGSLENLSMLNFYGCSKLRTFPRSLNSRSLRKLDFICCSSLRYLPEIKCKMESIKMLHLYGAIEELPLSIGNLVGLESLYLWDCKNLMRLPIACIQLQHLKSLCIRGCPNLVKKMGNDGISLLAIESTTMQDEISLCEETNFFPISSFFTKFKSSANLRSLDLSDTEIVSLPTSIKEFVALRSLYLPHCEKLEEIPELPPNIEKVGVRGCKSLERFPEVSKILEFNGSHIRSLKEINLHGCDKMHMNIWNDKVQNPLLWKGVSEYDATLFPENQIPEWLSYVHEFLKDDDIGHDDDDDDDGWREGDDWLIDIEGPHYLEEISGIVLYAVMFYKDAGGYCRCFADITSNGSNVMCCSEGVHLLDNDMNDYSEVNMPEYVVWVGYSNLQSFERKVLEDLRVRCKFYYLPGTVPFYKSCRVKVVYKNEMDEKPNLLSFQRRRRRRRNDVPRPGFGKRFLDLNIDQHDIY